MDSMVLSVNQDKIGFLKDKDLTKKNTYEEPAFEQVT